jgi:hypothetical protein
MRKINFVSTEHVSHNYVKRRMIGSIRDAQ